MKTNIHKKLVLLIVALVLPLSMASADHHCNIPTGDWVEDGGYSRTGANACPDGLGFPAFNAYSQSNIWADTVSTLRDSELNFAFVRRFDADGDIVGYTNEMGFRNQITLHEGEQAQAMVYVHNTGNPTMNETGPNGSVVARNVRMKLNGLTRVGDEYVSEAGTRHTFSVSITADNTYPRTVTDEFIVNTPAGYQVRLKDTFGAICTPSDPSCRTTRFTPNDLVRGRGMPISSRFQGSGAPDGNFYGSEEYRRRYLFALNIIEEPEEEFECSSLTITGPDTSDFATGAPVTLHVDVNPDIFEEDIDFELSGPGSFVPSRNNTRVVVSGWTDDTVLSAQVEGASTACGSNFIFEEAVTEVACEDLDLFTTLLNEEARTAVVGISVDPDLSRFRNAIEVSHSGSGSSSLISGSSIIVNGWDDDTSVSARVPGFPGCIDTVHFDVEPELDVCESFSIDYDIEDFENYPEDNELRINAHVNPDDLENRVIWDIDGPGNILRQSSDSRTIWVTNLDGGTHIRAYVDGFRSDCNDDIELVDIPVPLCTDLNMEPYHYDYIHTGGFPEFEIYEVTPRSFGGPFIWSVFDKELGRLVEVTDEAALTRFTPAHPLNGNQEVRVSVPDELEAYPGACQDKAISHYPPPHEICPGLAIKRAHPLAYGRRGFIPRDGSPIKLELTGFGEYEGDVIWQSSEPGLIITDGVNENDGSLQTDIHNAVIVRGGSHSTILNVFLADPDAFTTDAHQCTDHIISGRKGETGDKPAYITKVADKSYVVDGEPVTYTVTYTPVSGFFDEQFQNVTLYDNIGNIGGLPGDNTEISPGRLVPVSQNLYGVQLPSSGSIVSPAGLTIENIHTLPLDSSIHLSYTAKVESNLNPTTCGKLESDCGEIFTNTVTDNFAVEDSAEVFTTCPFVLSRGFGDVFLERDFTSGVDIHQCSARTSSEGPVFTPATPDENQEVVSTGSRANIRPTHRICANSGDDSNPIPEYGDVLPNFSSSVCELAILNIEELQRAEVEKDLKINEAKIGRGNTNLNGEPSPLTSLTDEGLSRYDSLNPNQDNPVYRKTNGNVIIGNGSGDVSVSGAPKTIIVKGHDLIINSNIKYADGQSAIAFLVIGGDIKVAPGVTSIEGVYAAVQDGTGGKMDWVGGDSSNSIVITGSIMADIEPLLENTSSAGNFNFDRGAVTVRYDGRIVNNTPPGLEAVIEFNQFQTATGSSLFEE